MQLKYASWEIRTWTGRYSDMKPWASETVLSDGDGSWAELPVRDQPSLVEGRGESRYLLRSGAWQQSAGDVQEPRWEPKRSRAGVSRNVQAGALNRTKWVRLVRW